MGGKTAMKCGSLSSVSSRTTSTSTGTEAKAKTWKWGAVSAVSESRLDLAKANTFFNWLMGVIAKQSGSGYKWSRVSIPVVGLEHEVGVVKGVEHFVKEGAHLIFLVKDRNKDELSTCISNVAGVDKTSVVFVDLEHVLSKYKGRAESWLNEKVADVILKHILARFNSASLATPASTMAPPRPVKFSWAVVSTVPTEELSVEEVQKFFAYVLHHRSFCGNWKAEPVAIHVGVTRQQDYRRICLQLVKEHPSLEFIWTAMDGLKHGNAQTYGWKKAVESSLAPTLSQGILAINVKTSFKHALRNTCGKGATSVDHMIRRLSGTIQTKLNDRGTGITDADREAKLRSNLIDLQGADDDDEDSA